MTTPHSDAFVFFGATGDLAFKKIFPSLQAMVKHGRLDVPVIGVARSAKDVEELRTRARASLEQSGKLDPVEILGSRLPQADEMDAYERVLSDAMAGDATLFARQDYVEEAWRIVDPSLQAATPVFEYEPGTWGPKEVDQLTPLGGWQNPIVTG